eukprot:773946_1
MSSLPQQVSQDSYHQENDNDHEAIAGGDTEMVVVHEDNNNTKSQLEEAIHINSDSKDKETETEASNNSDLNLKSMADIEPYHDITQLHYILHNHRINGPYTINEITSLYVYKQIKSGETLYISSADGQSEWLELQIPENMMDITGDPGEAIHDLLTKNSPIKKAYPKLYRSLVEHVMLGKIRPVQAPHEIPEKERKEMSKFVVRRLLGKILFILILVIILAHIAPLFIFSILIMLCALKCESNLDGHDTVEKITVFLFYFLMLSGLIASPIVVCYLILTETEMYDEIQSWMIAYIVWGIFTFMVLTTYTILTIILQGRKQKKYLRTVNRIIFFIVAIDFGAFDIISMLSAKNVYIEDIFSGQAMGLVTFFLQMPIASLLPSAVCGFIANYILQEKFELKCRTEIVNTNICFNSLEYGCCEVISSHNWMNSYAFMGRFASNILAVWAIIRICGYLLANARSDYAIHAKRTK